MDGLVDAVYVINMDGAHDRMADVAAQCEAQGIPYRRVPAVDGRKVKPHVLEQVATPLCQKLCTPSMLGCALSHMKVWKAVLQAGHGRVLVLEDDAVLVPDFKERLRRALADAPPDFDVLVCGCFFLCDKDRDYSVGNRVTRLLMPQSRRTDRRTWGSVFVPEFFGGTHCYVVSNKGARRLFKVIPRAHFHIDMSMNNPDLAIYAVSPDLAFQRDMADSSIASFAFPKTLTPVLEGIRDNKRISLAYYMDVPWAQVGGRRINAWAAVFLLLGLLIGRAASPYVAGVLLADLLVGGDITVPAAAFALGWAASFGARRVISASLR